MRLDKILGPGQKLRLSLALRNSLVCGFCNDFARACAAIVIGGYVNTPQKLETRSGADTLPCLSVPWAFSISSDIFWIYVGRSTCTTHMVIMQNGRRWLIGPKNKSYVSGREQDRRMQKLALPSPARSAAQTAIEAGSPIYLLNYPRNGAV
jgi:hypothetical protein